MDTPEAHAVVVSRRVQTMPMTITSSLGGMSAQSRLSAAQQEARQAQDTAQRLRSEADAALTRPNAAPIANRSARAD